MFKSLPVAMYHYVSSWPNPIAVDPDVFESHLQALTRAGYHSVSLAEAEECLRDGRELEQGAVLLSFDDGFLDNFVNAWPLLEKHGHKATVFTVTNKIVVDDMPRPTLKGRVERVRGHGRAAHGQRPHAHHARRAAGAARPVLFVEGGPAHGELGRGEHGRAHAHAPVGVHGPAPRQALPPRHGAPPDLRPPGPRDPARPARLRTRPGHGPTRPSCPRTSSTT